MPPWSPATRRGVLESGAGGRPRVRGEHGRLLAPMGAIPAWAGSTVSSRRRGHPRAVRGGAAPDRGGRLELGIIPASRGGRVRPYARAGTGSTGRRRPPGAPRRPAGRPLRVVTGRVRPAGKNTERGTTRTREGGHGSRPRRPRTSRPAPGFAAARQGVGDPSTASSGRPPTGRRGESSTALSSSRSSSSIALGSAGSSARPPPDPPRRAGSACSWRPPASRRVDRFDRWSTGWSTGWSMSPRPDSAHFYTTARQTRRSARRWFFPAGPHQGWPHRCGHPLFPLVAPVPGNPRTGGGAFPS
jgi:hypothetical protein